MQRRRKSGFRMKLVQASAAFVAACVTLAVTEPSDEAQEGQHSYAEPETVQAAAYEAPTETRAAAAADEEEAEADSIRFSDSDADILMRLAMAEAEGESTYGKALVMLSVMNRVDSKDFPDTIEGVVFQKAGGSYQFSSVIPGGRYWTKAPNDDCKAALRLVESGWDESSGALYFESCAGQSWHSRNLEFLFSCGRHNFYR